MVLKQSTIDLINEIKSVNGSIAKTALLKKGDDEFQWVLNAALNKMVSYGLNSKSVNKHDKESVERLGLGSLVDLLVGRKLTGHDALAHTKKLFNSCSEDERPIIEGIFNRDLKLGVGTTIINKVFPKLIPKFDVALADRFDKLKGKNIPDYKKDQWLVQSKLDGVRCVIVVKDYNAVAYSRSGKIYLTLGNLIKTVETYAKQQETPDFVLDGEAIVLGDNGINDFSKCMREITKKDHTMESVIFTTFDYISYDGFIDRFENTPYTERFTKAKDFVEAIDSNFFTLVRFEGMVKDEDSLIKRLTEVSNAGEEGLIIRKATSPYEGKRTKTLLKLKKFHDAEYEVVGQDFDNIQYSEYHVDGKIYVDPKSMTKEQRKVAIRKPVEARMLKNVFITHKGTKVGVGSGFSHLQRISVGLFNTLTYPNVYEDTKPFDIFDRDIQVQYFEETKNKQGEYSLRFPTCAYIYDGKREV